MSRPELDLSQVLTCLETDLKDTIEAISASADTSLFNPDIEAFIKKYPAPLSYTSLDELLDASIQTKDIQLPPSSLPLSEASKEFFSS